jgi:hypothetical protein
MAKMGVRIDGIMVLTGVALVGGYYLYKKRNAIIAGINPADSRNIVNQAVVGVVGQEKINAVGDKIFAAIDLINPFNESDAYARMVYGLDGVVKPAVQSDKIVLN